MRILLIGQAAFAEKVLEGLVAAGTRSPASFVRRIGETSPIP